MRKPPRVARPFHQAISLEAMLDLIDRDPVDSDRLLVLEVAETYMKWAIKGKRDAFQWPLREGAGLEQLLAKLGFSSQQINCASLSEQDGFVEIRILREPETRKLMNHQIAWLLVVAHIAAQCQPTQMLAALRLSH